MQPFLSLTLSEKHRFAETLLTWFAANARDLPWRRTYDPYGVWVSEIMLQQTQMDRAVNYFNAWMERFPSISAVAEAPEEAILKAWEGLGYYRRARNLHTAAKILVAENGGEIPTDLNALHALPGVGEYTAAAILSIAYNDPHAAVDANVLRIFSRICDIDVPVTHTGVKGFVSRAVASVMPPDKARQFTQTLMEFGALVCAKVPRCTECPVKSYCEAFRLGTVAKRPKQKVNLGYTWMNMATAVLCRQGKILIQKRPQYGVWAGLWETPGGCLEPSETPEQALLREVMEETELSVVIREKLAVIRHSYTTCRVTMHAYLCELPSENPEPPEPVLHAATEYIWATPDEISALAFPAGHRKLWDSLRQKAQCGFPPS